MTISIIAALTHDRVIGRNNKLPWTIPEELEHFKKLTTGSAVIMGRKTFESIGKPLLNRKNIVVSKKMQDPQGILVMPTLQSAIEKSQQLSPNTFVIGGERMFQEALPIADKLYLSVIKQACAGDKFFPRIDERAWNITREEDKGLFVLKVFEKKGA